MRVQTLGSVQDGTQVRLTTVEGEPLCETLYWSSDGFGECSVEKPVGIALPIELPSIGRVYLWANNRHRGYSSQRAPIVLEQELVRHYLSQVSEMSAKYARKKVPTDIVEHSLQQAKQADPNDWRTQLNAVVQAGETLVSTIARTRLSRMGGRGVFLWGIRLNTPQLPNLTPQGKNLFNMLAISLDSEADWTPLLQTAQRERLVVKGERLITPEVVRQWQAQGSFSQEVMSDYLHNTIGRYRGAIRYWDIGTHIEQWIPEPFRNISALAEFLTLLCEMARTLDFGMVRLLAVSHSLYYRRSGLSVLRQLVDANVPFEAVHLTLHWHDGDLFFLGNLIELYGDLGKPLYLTVVLPPEERTANSFWRAEPEQWFEQVCLITLSKPFVVGVTFPAYESLEEGKNHLPHGGMFRPEGHPSLYWHHLQKLR